MHSPVILQHVIEKFETGELKLLDIDFGYWIDDERITTIFEYRERNCKRWENARRLQRNDVIHTDDMYEVISRISWDQSLLWEAMRTNASRILNLFHSQRG